jgi:hypothetical protein
MASDIRDASVYLATPRHGQAGYLHLDLRRPCHDEKPASSDPRCAAVSAGSVALVVAEAPVPSAGMAAVAGCPSAYFRADPVCLLGSN